MVGFFVMDNLFKSFAKENSLWFKKLFPILIVLSLVLTSCVSAIQTQIAVPMPTAIVQPMAVPEFPLTIMDKNGLPELIDFADLTIELKAIKYPFREQKIPAQIGIDY